MSRPTQAKYCPRCRAMNFLDAATCLHCGHEFRTGMASPPPSDQELNRTQMFMMPPPAGRPKVQEAAPPPVAGLARLASRLAVARASPLLPVIGILILVIAALIYWVVRSFR